MGVVIVKEKVTKDNIKKASAEYGQYMKIVVDVKNGSIAIGGQWHADAEKKLLEVGSLQEDLWGGGIDIKTKQVDYNALINIRPDLDNPSMEIIDKEIRKKFLDIVKKKFEI